MNNKIIEFGAQDMSYEIMTDSASNLTQDLLDKYRIKMISYISMVDGKEFHCYDPSRDEADAGHDFYEAMRDGADTRTTLINSARFMEFFEPVLKEGSGTFSFVQDIQMARRQNQILNIICSYKYQKKFQNNARER